MYDANYDNNAYPRRIGEKRIELGDDDDESRNLMRDIKVKREGTDDE